MKKTLILTAALLLALCVCAAGCVGNDEPSNGGGGASSSEEVSSGEELDVKVGDSFTFGTYNGKALGWDVLAVDAKNEKALLISEKCIDIIAFHKGGSTVTWESSEIRAWLNDDFYDNTFSDTEKALILETLNKNPANSNTGVSGCADTADRIFLLSEKEALAYFETDEARIAKTYDGDTFQWWLRTPGDGDTWFMLITEEGSLYYAGSTSTSSYGVRPAFWLDLSEPEEE